jgi:hypothetical protein
MQGGPSIVVGGEARFCGFARRVVWFHGVECVTPLPVDPNAGYSVCSMMVLQPGFCYVKTRPVSAHEALEDRIRRSVSSALSGSRP